MRLLKTVLIFILWTIIAFSAGIIASKKCPWLSEETKAIVPVKKSSLKNFENSEYKLCTCNICKADALGICNWKCRCEDEGD